jgi:hypothetical protein
VSSLFEPGAIESWAIDSIEENWVRLADLSSVRAIKGSVRYNKNA